MEDKIQFKEPIFIIGCGAVFKCLLAQLENHFELDWGKVTIFDVVDRTDVLSEFIEKGLTFKLRAITRSNFKQELKKVIPLDHTGLFIELACSISTYEVSEECKRRGIMFINAGGDLWEELSDGSIYLPTFHLISSAITLPPLPHTVLCSQDQSSHSLQPPPSYATQILCSGCNPGLVNLFVKKGIEDFANNLCSEGILKSEDIKKANEKGGSALLQLLEIECIHITELDDQDDSRTSKKDVKGKFANTWSNQQFYWESVSRPEYFTEKGTWVVLPENATKYSATSWVPRRGYYTGKIVTHEECLSLPNYYASDGYHIRCLFVYRPCRLASLSLENAAKDSFENLTPWDLGSELETGADIVGALLISKKYGTWWCGVICDIDFARKFAPHSNATTWLVAASLLGNMKWMCQNRNCGVGFVENHPYQALFENSKEFLGEVISTKGQPIDLDEYKQLDDCEGAIEMDISQFVSQFKQKGCAAMSLDIENKLDLFLSDA